METTLAFVLGAAGLVLLAVLVFVLLRLNRDLSALKAARDADDNASGMLMLQGQVDALREQVRVSLEGGRLEVDRRLAETNRVVGEVRRGLGEVDRQVRSVSDAARDLKGLQELLRAPKLRGGLGELMLAELLAQVLPGAHYDLQYGFPGGERVDAALKVGDRRVPVDAKFPLDSFRRYKNAETPAEQQAAQRALRTDIKRHIDAIADRYIRPAEGTYDFAMMYIPAESVYHHCMLPEDESADLFDYAMGRRVIPVSPQSFYAYLQVIVLGLRGLSIEERAREIMGRLAELRGRLGKFHESFEVALKHLGNAERQFGEAERRLARLDDAIDALEADPETVTAPAGVTHRREPFGGGG